MKRHRLDTMIKGWFVGNFTPAALQSASVEVAVKSYHAGHCEKRHLHMIADEVTLIVSGEARMGDQYLVGGDILVIDAGEAVDFEALTDVLTVVVKLPSVAGDKYEC